MKEAGGERREEARKVMKQAIMKEKRKKKSVFAQLPKYMKHQAAIEEKNEKDR